MHLWYLQNLYHKKKKKIFWLTGMERESVESLLLLLSWHRPLTTHHERLSSNVNEMLSDLCRFLLSLRGSSEEFSSGHIQEFLLLQNHLCNMQFWIFLTEALSIIYVYRNLGRIKSSFSIVLWGKKVKAPKTFLRKTQ